MPSPCTGACRAVGGLCVSCGRTLAEIGRWSAMDEAEQGRVMDELAGRRATQCCERCGEPLYCAVTAGEGIAACWCSQTRPLPFEATASGCLCRRCHGEDQQRWEGMAEVPPI
ncbi:DUF1289 domain-containing protein [Aeromonas simiae]|uniref:DUF1289 domain-containing protein n=1 Tax=Aeromonas simiae TaxID=218936 RepID=A0A5J6WZ61_9GAMM|nr:DUF1289 domain-containing protein [Aeromonas simiae]QFI54625.1 DUF1289 domain-containing protein [Aeromonas simiae]